MGSCPGNECRLWITRGLPCLPWVNALDHANPRNDSLVIKEEQINEHSFLDSNPLGRLVTRAYRERLRALFSALFLRLLLSLPRNTSAIQRSLIKWTCKFPATFYHEIPHIVWQSISRQKSGSSGNWGSFVNFLVR